MKHGTNPRLAFRCDRRRSHQDCRKWLVRCGWPARSNTHTLSCFGQHQRKTIVISPSGVWIMSVKSKVSPSHSEGRSNRASDGLPSMVMLRCTDTVGSRCSILTKPPCTKRGGAPPRCHSGLVSWPLLWDRPMAAHAPHVVCRSLQRSPPLGRYFAVGIVVKGWSTAGGSRVTCGFSPCDRGVQPPIRVG